ncbi:hypothetical protein Jinkies_50 [Arthrobacter phage Jinkies]|uniref:Uncharacterized protein n=1 Tax=Arthrobacter phage Jinkies TaxID=2743903 RepID=A0A7S6BF88_9CAUD|nr:hypothetical protein Jinkies_50 [Arthrobacter phage Jinkies]
MSNYVHGATTRRPATEADLAQARHHNSRLAAELRQLEAIGERLQAAINETKTRLEAERDAALAELNALKAQKTGYIDDAQAMINYRARMALLPPPVFGGRQGLLAATAELEGRDARDHGNSHGTKKRYYDDGCRCEKCEAWHDRHKARAKARYHQTTALKAVA